MRNSGTLLSDFSNILLNIRVCECVTKPCQFPHETDITGSEFSGSAVCKTQFNHQQQIITVNCKISPSFCLLCALKPLMIL